MTDPSVTDPSPEAPAAPALSPMLPDGQPDWDAITFDVFCSRCEYNLKTLTRPHCPECGLQFDWPQVLDQAAWRSDFLFEHHWRTRPVRSWFRTVRKAFRPGRFWREVSIHDRIRAGPLWFMLGFSVIPYLVVLHATAGIGWFIVDQLLLKWFPPGYFGPWVLESIAGRFHHIALLPFASSRACLQSAATLWLVLLAALALLCSLRQTLGRCRVRSIHILRIISYVSTPVLVLIALWELAMGCGLASLQFEEIPAAVISIIVIAFAMLLVVLIVFLGLGLRLYLRLPHAWPLAVATAIVAFLFSFAVSNVFALYM